VPLCLRGNSREKPICDTYSRSFDKNGSHTICGIKSYNPSKYHSNLNPSNQNLRKSAS